MTQHHLGVADDANVHWPVAADLFVRNIDLNNLHILGKAWRQAKANDEVEPGTDDQHHVGLFPRLVARAEEAQGMVFGDHPPTLRGGVERDAAQLDELFQFLHRVRPEHAGASKDDRPLGLLEQSDRSLDQIGVALDTGDSVRLFEELHLTLLHRPIQHIAGEVDVNGTRLPARSHAERFVDDFRDAAGVEHPLGPFGDGLEHSYLIHLLERAHAGL